MCENSSHQWELSCLSTEVSVNSVLSISAAERKRGNAGTNYRGLGPHCVAYVFVFLSSIRCN